MKEDGGGGAPGHHTGFAFGTTPVGIDYGRKNPVKTLRNKCISAATAGEMCEKSPLKNDCKRRAGVVYDGGWSSAAGGRPAGHPSHSLGRDAAGYLKLRWNTAAAKAGIFLSSANRLHYHTDCVQTSSKISKVGGFGQCLHCQPIALY